MLVDRPNPKPLNYAEIKRQKKFKDYEKKWRKLLKNGSTEAIVDDFLFEVGPLLDTIRLDSPVSDLRSETTTHSSEKSGSTPKVLDWVDLVLAGGALLGVAHVGYIFALEHAGVRFRAIGGTSAGALAAVLLAGLRTKPDAPAGRKLLDLLLGMPVPKFKDGKLLDRRVGDAILSLMTDLPSSPWKWLMLPAFPVALVRVWLQGGIHPGDALEDWVHEQLAANGAGTLAGLKGKCDLSEINFKQDVLDNDSASSGVRPYWESVEGLVVAVAADVTSGIKAVLSWKRDRQAHPVPLTHSELYWSDPDLESPARCVRASVSLPLYFRPMTVPRKRGEKLPLAGQNASRLPDSKWADTGFTTTIPDRVRFQDGGVLSRFPINLFHVPPTTEVHWPTFGVGLSPPRQAKSTSGLGQLLYASISTAIRIQDIQFTAQNREYEMLTKTVDVGQVCALDFKMSILGKFVLFYNGVLAARDFLMGTKEKKGFQWEKFKILRRERSAVVLNTTSITPT